MNNFKVLLITLALLAIFPIISQNWRHGDLQGALTLLVLFWTFLAIIWYSKETQELKEATIKRPCVSLYKKGTEIKIKNYGDGVAREIKINSIEWIFPLLSSKGFEELPDRVTNIIRDSTETITLRYYDINKEFGYTTELRWNQNNKDGVHIEEYEKENITPTL